MKSSQKVLLVFIFLGVLFIVGTIFYLEILYTVSSLLLIPVLILYYRYKVQTWFLPMVVVLMLFYIRDLLMLGDLGNYIEPIMWIFGTAIVILYIFALTAFQRSHIHPVEIFSLVIMYGFLVFLFFTIADLVPQVVPSYKVATYIYIFSLILLLAITFTQYLLKSHYASLWLMLASASLLVSELSLFFRLYIISDISVNVFFPLFHVIAYYALIEHAVHRRRSNILPGF
ncbi:hypothetical protein [Salinimicrobium xinjiangense]|uniref:hypothetical protein n=1 Tax=Salinimicrobium xinjiangense TaxID=438596 RepID=UPI00040D45F4|nr:hypothetical protein [Salinimicrobium xinjiangense]